VTGLDARPLTPTRLLQDDNLLEHGAVRLGHVLKIEPLHDVVDEIVLVGLLHERHELLRQQLWCERKA
jgi:hypothetical protein